MNMFENWDYICIGCAGYAMVGQQDYSQKIKIEMNYLMDLIKEKHPVPKEFNRIAYYTVKAFDHEFGRYHEIVIMYNRDLVDEMEYSENEKHVELHERFYDWVNDAECFDMESEEILQAIDMIYNEKEADVAVKQLIYETS